MESFNLQPVHPGEILLEEFLEPMSINSSKLAEDINVSLATINEIIEGQQSINAEIALRLSKYFGLSERFWLNLQVKYDLEVTKDRLKNCLETEVKSIKM
ncbi:HigA family addiction module antitoxin [Cyanothece sp. BG0011]|uniref:HigA family addiction module antitoxin n=1 Tax=Cyanothece sp. BG0011 TaxID=2082950 RepID=UPI000D1EE764|nr:HigA family addiction module antitoxin [Cyanothece sp. BG0011]